MKVLVTTLGRSHFVQVATSLVKSGVDARLFQGWVVKCPERSLALKLAARIVGRESLIWGFSKRMTPDLEGRVKTDFLAEFVDTFGKRIGRNFGVKGWNLGVKLGFWLHGFRTRGLLSHGQFDIFHVKSGLGAGGAIEAAHKAGTKVLADHSAGSPNFVMEQVYGKKLEPWSYWWTVMQDCEKADLLMVDCDWVKETFTMYGFPAEKIRVVYMGLDEKFNGLKQWGNVHLGGVGLTSDNPLRVVFTGGFAYHKGNEAFLGAVEKLLDSGLYFEFKAIGDRSISAEQKSRYCRALNVIKFMGHLPQDEMMKNMLDSHVYLFPSLSEGCAKSAYEALSMGLCVVCTKETGLPIVDGISGHIIEKKNAGSIEKKILWLAAHPEVIRSTGLAGIEEMKKHTWTHYAEEVKAVYRELLRR